jgi:hypothetical protein
VVDANEVRLAGEARPALARIRGTVRVAVDEAEKAASPTTRWG